MASDYQLLQELLGDAVKENEPLARYTTLKIGGPADFFFCATTIPEFVRAVTSAQKLHMPFFLLGGGSNILIGDRGIRGLVIKNNTKNITMKGMKGEYKRGKQAGTVFVEAESGVNTNALVRFTVEAGLQGLEMHLGLPGTVGGALYMNSKWTKPVGYIGDAVYQAVLLTPTGEVTTVPQSYFRFGYDQSILQQSQDLVLSAVFALTPAQKDDLWKIANASMAYRRISQPQGVFSPGCTFRNISKAQAIALSTPEQSTSAGFLLDHAGLKGLTIGDAQISRVHANFISNLGKAKADHVVQLIEKAKTKVKDQFGVTLEEEIVRVGEF